MHLVQVLSTVKPYLQAVAQRIEVDFSKKRFSSVIVLNIY